MLYSLLSADGKQSPYRLCSPDELQTPLTHMKHIADNDRRSHLSGSAPFVLGLRRGARKKDGNSSFFLAFILIPYVLDHICVINQNTEGNSKSYKVPTPHVMASIRPLVCYAEGCV